MRPHIVVNGALAVSAAWLVSIGISARPQQSSAAARMIEDEISAGLPLTPCAVPALAARIAGVVGAPAGIEHLPVSCTYDRSRSSHLNERLTLSGVTVGEALDRLVELDPRYRSVDADGVIVVRPLLAWVNADHFLHRTVPSFVVSDQNLGGALSVVLTALGPWNFGSGSGHGLPTAEGQRRFSVTLNATSILEALGAVVRAYGALRWEITYCQPPARYEHATMWLKAFDGSALGGHAVFLRDQNGRLYSPCSSSRRR